MLLDKEQAYYEAHKEELRKRYLGRRIIISGNEVKGDFDTDGQAFQAAVHTMNLEPGTFMIKPVFGTDQEAIQRYMTRVYV